jgi:8-oxo-dGTP pyrophosphatase MutT (NUDIX family)
LVAVLREAAEEHGLEHGRGHRKEHPVRFEDLGDRSYDFSNIYSLILAENGALTQNKPTDPPEHPSDS